MKHIRISILFLLAALALLAAVLVAYISLFSWIKQHNETISEMQGKLASENQQAAEERKLEAIIKETSDNSATLNSYFVEGDKAVDFLQTIEGYGSYSGASVKFSTVDYNATNQRLTMSLHIAGTFQSVYRTILLLENAPYEFDFSHIVLVLDQDPLGTHKGPSSWHTDIDFSLKSFSLK